MAYATVEDIAAMFPRMVRNQDGSVQDSTISLWLDDAAGVIHSAFYSRGLEINNLSHPLISDPTATTPILDQPKILRGINIAYATWKTAEVIWNAITPAEQAMARGQYNFWQTSLKNISSGSFDKLFYIGARTVDIFPAFGGVGGAEIDGTPSTAPIDDSTTRAFFKNQIF